MILSTMNDLPGYEITEVLGEVFGITVRSRNVGSQFGAGLKSLVGGELKGMTKMPSESRLHARDRLVEAAQAKGADGPQLSRMGHNYVETEHILLALLELENGTGVLTSLSLDKTAIEASIAAALADAAAQEQP
jgi:uncharacterized protein YbjQ (UPF0145 family)